jgi:1,6-anhydro-N-acetylmuramate kinase
MDRPEFASLRENAREAIAQEAQVVARLAWQKLGEALANNELDPRDLVMAAGMATDKAQLLNGGATARAENRDITGTLSDADLIAAIREADRLTSAQGAPEAPAGEAAGE